jgi:hypothetical protein
MRWNVVFHPAFAREFEKLATVVQDELAAFLVYLEEAGPTLRRPYADTLNGSRHSNMKELRFSASSGVWRVAFAFDPERRAIILVAGDKSGVKQSRFYKGLIRTADSRFDEHLKSLEASR